MSLRIVITVRRTTDSAWDYVATADIGGISTTHPAESDSEARAINYAKSEALRVVSEAFNDIDDVIEFEVRRP